jgi:hypothetical protein
MRVHEHPLFEPVRRLIVLPVSPGPHAKRTTPRIEVADPQSSTWRRELLTAFRVNCPVCDRLINAIRQRKGKDGRRGTLYLSPSCETRDGGCFKHKRARAYFNQLVAIVRKSAPATRQIQGDLFGAHP